MPERFDYIIVGAGAAGCVLARRLVGAGRVLLLEAGRASPSIGVAVPRARLMDVRPLYWRYQLEPQTHLGDRRLEWPAGKGVGGSTLINGTMYVRGNARDYDDWRAAGNAGWGYRDVLPYFRRGEDQERGPNEYHGVGGPLHVSDQRHRAEFSQRFADACAHVGLPYNDDFNGASQMGFGFLQVTQRKGMRASAATAYLAPVKRDPRLSILTGAEVSRVLFAGRKAIGVRFRHRDELRDVYADREIVLTAGTMRSPHILMLSGIGPADELTAAGIPVVADLPGVGHNLQDHPGIEVAYDPIRRPHHANVLDVLVYLATRRGVLTSTCEAAAFVSSTAERPLPDLQLLCNWSALNATAVGIEVVLASTISRGRLWLRSSDPADPPLIDADYLSDDREVATMLHGFELVRSLYAAPPLRAFVRGERWPGAHVRAKADLFRAIREQANTCYHPVGTCRMGCDDQAVVDPELRVRSVENLRVADASIMPVIPRGNTQAPTYMIAEKASDLVLSARA